MEFDELFGTLREADKLTAQIERLLAELAKEKSLKRAYRSALIEACHGSKAEAKKISRRHIKLEK